MIEAVSYRMKDKSHPNPPMQPYRPEDYPSGLSIF